MSKSLLTYLFLSTLLLLSSRPCYATITDKVTGALENANGYMEDAKSYQEQYTTVAKEYIDGKVGAIGDIQGAALKSEKIQKKKKWVERKVAKAKKQAEKAKKLAKDAKKVVSDAKKYATDAKNEIEKAKEKVEKTKKGINDAKQMANDITDTASAIKDVAKGKVENMQEKAGLSSEDNNKSQAAAEALANQSAQIANKAQAIENLSGRAVAEPLSLEENLMQQTPTLAISADEVMSNAQSIEEGEIPLSFVADDAEQGLSVSDINRLGTVELPQIPAAEEELNPEDVDLAAPAVLEPEVAPAKTLPSRKNFKGKADSTINTVDDKSNQVKVDQEASAKLEAGLQEGDAKKREELRKFYKGRQSFKRQNTQQAVGGSDE